MFNRVVVGIDAESHGRDAIALAGQLADVDATLVFAHVHRGYPLTVATVAGPSETYRCVEDRDAQSLLEAARAEAGVHAELRSVAGPGVGALLHRVVEEEQAKLLVIGSTRRSPLGRIEVGDHMAQALNGAPCAVAIAPIGHAERRHPIESVGVAFDGTPESTDALAFARELADERNAKLSACTVVSPRAYGAAVSNRESIRFARGRLAELGEQIDCRAAVGDPGEELGIYSGSVDLLVAGSRGYGPFGRLMQGHTARRLMRAARAPLIVLPRGARAVGHLNAHERPLTHA